MTTHDPRWGFHVAVTLALVVGTAALLAVGWYSLEQATRRDPSRCANQDVARSEVVVGGWAEPDECAHFDRQGLRVGGEPQLAGPVTRTYSDVLADNLFGLVVAVVLTGGAGVVLAGRRVRGDHPQSRSI